MGFQRRAGHSKGSVSLSLLFALFWHNRCILSLRLSKSQVCLTWRHCRYVLLLNCASQITQALLNSTAPGTPSLDSLRCWVRACARLVRCKHLQGIKEIPSPEPKFGYSPYVHSFDSDSICFVHLCFFFFAASRNLFPICYH